MPPPADFERDRIGLRPFPYVREMTPRRARHAGHADILTEM